MTHSLDFDTSGHMVWIVIWGSLITEVIIVAFLAFMLSMFTRFQNSSLTEGQSCSTTNVIRERLIDDVIE